MCGRYTLTYADLDEVVAMLDAVLDPAAAALYRPRYNIAPTHRAIVARAASDRPALVPAVWGLYRDRRLIINVRSESAASRFPAAYQGGRCVVPADGFYEWAGERSERRPIWFHAPDGSPLLMAGICDERREASRDVPPNGPPDGLPAFAVLTTASRPPIAAVHQRMPVLLSREGARSWLLGQPPRVLRPDAVALAARPVSPRANSTAHDDPACLEAMAEPAKQLGLFR